MAWLVPQVKTALEEGELKLMTLTEKEPETAVYVTPLVVLTTSTLVLAPVAEGDQLL